jgi:hypothetical protein
MAFLTTLSWVAFGIDYIDRHRSEASNSSEIIEEWGRSGNSFRVTVNTSSLIDYQEKYKVGLIVIVSYPNIDMMTDTAIGKSELYTITGGDQIISGPKTDDVRAVPGALLRVKYVGVLMPSGFSMDQVRTLSDIRKLGGRILDIAEMGDILRSTNHPVALPPSPTKPVSPEEK